MYRNILGYSFLFLGLVAAFIPFLQGWIFVIIGLVLLKDTSWARRIRVWLHHHYPKSRPTFRKMHKRIEKWTTKWWRSD